MTAISNACFTRENLPDLTVLELGAEGTDRFIVQMNETLANMVGEALCASLSDAEVAEFGRLADGDSATALDWAVSMGIDPRTCPLFQSQLADQGPSVAPESLLTGWATTRWLGIHRPDYHEVVDRCVETMMADLGDLLEAVGA